MAELSEGAREWTEQNVRACSFCGRRDWRLLQTYPGPRVVESRDAWERINRDDAVICERCAAGCYELCEVNLGEGWYRGALQELRDG